MRWSRRSCPILLLIAWIAAGEASRALAQVSGTGSLTDAPQIYLDPATLLRKELAVLDNSAPTPTNTPKLQMFRMPTGFMATPLSLVSDNDPVDPFAPADDDLRFLQITVGTHVPYLDMYKPGDPGGLGYYKVHSQMQVFDLGPTNVSIAVQAVTPMGLQAGGIANGQTVVAPSIAWFHDLGDGAAVHGYVGQQVSTDARWRDQLHSGFRCGLAVQHPLPFMAPTSEQGLYLFVQALGQYSPDSDRNDLRGINWDLVPGLQYRMNNACWMSMGFSRNSFLSCIWQY